MRERRSARNPFLYTWKTAARHRCFGVPRYNEDAFLCARRRRRKEHRRFQIRVNDQKLWESRARRIILARRFCSLLSRFERWQLSARTASQNGNGRVVDVFERSPRVQNDVVHTIFVSNIQKNKKFPTPGRTENGFVFSIRPCSQ